MDIFVGTAGFSYKDWEGTVYPTEEHVIRQESKSTKEIGRDLS